MKWTCIYAARLAITCIVTTLILVVTMHVFSFAAGSLVLHLELLHDRALPLWSGCHDYGPHLAQGLPEIRAAGLVSMYLVACDLREILS